MIQTIPHSTNSPSKRSFGNGSSCGGTSITNTTIINQINTINPSDNQQTFETLGSSAIIAVLNAVYPTGYGITNADLEGLYSPYDLVHCLETSDPSLAGWVSSNYSVSYLLNIIMTYDGAGFVNKALEQDFTMAQTVLCGSGYDMNTFMETIRTDGFFGTSVTNAIWTHFNGTPAGIQDKFTLNELDLYGSKRLGVLNVDTLIVKANYNGHTQGDEIKVDSICPPVFTLVYDTSYLHRKLGRKSYELTNHLGNVIATVSDRKVAIDSNADGIIDYYNADVRSVQEYYAYGNMLEGRQYAATNDYKFGMNGQERDDEVNGNGNIYTAEHWEYDSRIGRRWNEDPKPTTGVSDYSTFKCNPIGFSDPFGDSVWVYATTLPGNDNTILTVATHTFILVKTDDGKMHHYAYGPKEDKHGNVSFFGGSQMVEIDYPQDKDVYTGKDKVHIKARPILVPVPKGQTSNNFDNAVMKTAQSFGNNPALKYNAITNDDLTGNCNSSSSTILSKSGVSKEIISNIEGKIPGLNWGFGDVKPWTASEQGAAVGKKEQQEKKFIDAGPKYK